MFVQRGYQAVSIDEVARKAKVSKPTVYAYFESKDQLFITILEEACAKIAAPLIAPEIDHLPIQEVLVAHARSYARAALNLDILSLNRLMIAEAKRAPDFARRYYNAGPGAAYRAIEEFLRKRVAAGEIDCEDCETAARMYASSIISPYRLRIHLLVDDKPDWDRIDEQSAFAVKVFTRGLKPLR